MTQVTTFGHMTQPRHTHSHRVWWMPDTQLGLWAGVIFTGAALSVILAPLISYGIGLVVDDTASAPWFFALWGATLVALAVAAIAGAMALVALIRDHALLLIVPVAVGVVGTGLLMLRSGLPL
jgi:hypothetical protein